MNTIDKLIGEEQAAVREWSGAVDASFTAQSEFAETGSATARLQVRDARENVDAAMKKVVQVREKLAAARRTLYFEAHKPRPERLVGPADI